MSSVVGVQRVMALRRAGLRRRTAKELGAKRIVLPEPELRMTDDRLLLALGKKDQLEKLQRLK